MRMREGTRMDPTGHQPGKMRHVHHQQRADAIGDFPESAKIENARIGRAAGHDKFRLVPFCEALKFIEIDALIVAANAIGDDAEPLTREIHRRTVSKVAAGCEVEPHERVARLQERHEDRLIGLGARMRLDVGETAIKQTGHAFNGQRLDDIHKLTSAIVAATRISFNIFVS